MSDLRRELREMAEKAVEGAALTVALPLREGLVLETERCALAFARRVVEEAALEGCWSCREFGKPRLEGARWYHGPSGGICQRQELWSGLSSLSDAPRDEETR